MKALIVAMIVGSSTAGAWPIHQSPSNRTVVERYESGALKSSVPMSGGRRHGVLREWYASGQLASETMYWHGEKTSGHRRWWPDGRPRVIASYGADALTGEYRTFYASGAPYELRHYFNGHEDGVQQSWTEQGELYLNYDVRGGRRYGLINATPCLPVNEDPS